MQNAKLGGLPVLFTSCGLGGVAAYLSAARLGGQSLPVRAGAAFGVFMVA